MKINEYTKTGLYHLQRGEECQDRTLFSDDKNYSLAVISDGVTSCRNAFQGAETTCMAVKDFFLREGGRTFKYSPEKLSYLLTEHILFWLEKQAVKEETDVKEYASTVAAFFVDNKTGETLALSLGDSACCKIRDAQTKAVILPRRAHGQPCLVTTEGAYKAMTVRSMETRFEDALLLCTDGFIEALNQDGGKNEGIDYLLRQGNYEDMNSRLDRLEIRDDCSYIVLSRTR